MCMVTACIEHICVQYNTTQLSLQLESEEGLYFSAISSPLHPQLEHVLELLTFL